MFTIFDASSYFHTQIAYNPIIQHLPLLGLHDLLVLLLGDPLGLGRQQLIQEVWDDRCRVGVCLGNGHYNGKECTGDRCYM